MTDMTFVRASDARGIGDNQPPEPIEGEDDWLLGVDPTKLVVIETDKLIRLFELHYPELAQRAAELLERCQRWQTEHRTPAGGMVDIADDDENGQLADLMVLLDDFAKEVETARVSVKEPVYKAGIAIDGWFKRTLVDPVMDIRGVTRTVSGRKYPAPLGTMQFAQSKYLNDKAAREQAERDRIAREAAERAREAERIAREAAEQEAARIAALQKAGVAPQEAAEVAAQVTDRAAEEADQARATSVLIGAAAAQPARPLAHTAMGTTVGLAGNWEVEMEPAPGGIVALCKAVAEGKVPYTFVMADLSAIRAAVRSKQSPLRECPGVRIYQDFAARRRGAR